MNTLWVGCDLDGALQLGEEVGREVPVGRNSQASLSLVELLHYCALIGRELLSDEIFSK